MTFIGLRHVKMRGRFRADDVVPDYGTYGDLIGFTITLHDFLYDDNDGASWDRAIQSDHANQIGDNKIRIRGVTKWTRETIAGFEEFKNALMWTLLHVGEARGR